MDENVSGVLAALPPYAVTLRLARGVIRMRHRADWRVEKVNEVHDFVVCHTGAARYEIDGETRVLAAGEGMIIPAGARFVGRLERGPLYAGIAQHFSLSLFGEVDLIGQLRLAPKIRFPRWREETAPLVAACERVSPVGSTSLPQHHLSMALLLEFLGQAALGWREGALIPGGDEKNALALHITLAASRLTAGPLDEAAAEAAVAAAPYNPDYFRRAFKRHIGLTPARFTEAKRIEQAMKLLAGGRSVTEAALAVGFGDTYYFSRRFKALVGLPPSAFREKKRPAGVASGRPESDREASRR